MVLSLCCILEGGEKETLAILRLAFYLCVN